MSKLFSSSLMLWKNKLECLTSVSEKGELRVRDATRRGRSEKEEMRKRGGIEKGERRERDEKEKYK